MTAWISDRIKANGFKFHYHRSGGDKPPLVLCHGLTDNGLCWTRLAQVLEKEYDLIMCDARGHGLSDVPDSGYSSDDHAADVVALIKALDLNKPYLIGHSMGAATVATMIARHPQLAGRAILEDPPWQDPDIVDHSIEGRKEVAEEWHTEMMDRRAKSVEDQKTYGREIHPAWDEIEFDPWCASTHQANPIVLNYITETYTPWRELVSKITIPTLLITGDVDADALVSPKVAAEITRLQPNIKIVHISGAGHSIRREQFEQYVAVVTTFLRGDES